MPPRPNRYRTNIKRVRTGCLTCRERRIKCDEVTPSCRKCLRSGRICRRGVRVRFQHCAAFGGPEKNVRLAGPVAASVHALGPQDVATRSSGLTFLGATTTSNTLGSPPHIQGRIDEGSTQDFPNFVELHDGDVGPDVTTVSDDSIPSSGFAGTEADIASGAEGLRLSYPAISDTTPSSSYRSTPGESRKLTSFERFTTPNSGPEDMGDWVPAIPTLSYNMGVVDRRAELHSGRYGESPNSFNQSITSADLNSEALSGSRESESHTSSLKHRLLPQSKLTPDVELKLLENYLSQCALWCESTDTERHFSVKSVHQMMLSKPWRAAAIAISSRQQDLSHRSHPHQLSLELYQKAVESLIKGVTNAKVQSDVLAGCVLLTVYEMMTVEYSDWEKHLQGCASIFQSNNWNGSTGGLVGCCFWAYARIDVWASLCNCRETVIPTDAWFDNSSSVLEINDIHQDLYANIMTWLVAQIISFVARRENAMYQRKEQRSEWLRLWESVQRWKNMNHRASEPIMSLESGAWDDSSEDESPFPHIVYSSDSSVIGHTMYHTGVILLLEDNESETIDALDPFETADDQLYYHARRLCGIVESTTKTACLVNSLQPVWIGGRHLRTRSEKFGALQILSSIERSTGWKCGWRSECLRELWGIN